MRESNLWTSQIADCLKEKKRTFSEAFFLRVFFFQLSQMSASLAYFGEHL
jgi:hypothetical protein